MSKIKRKDIPSTSKGEGILTFLNAYLTYQEECVAFDRRWGDGTQERYLKYIKFHIIPYLRNHDHTPIQDYTLDDFIHVIDEVKRVGQHNDPNHYRPYQESMLRKFWHIMETVVTVTSSHESFPNVFFEASSGQQDGTDTKQIQQMKQFWLTPKSLSVQEEKRVLKYLLRNLEVRGENIALFLMYALGLRNEEACGVNFGYIKQMSSYPGHYYLQVPQSTVNHSNQTKVEMKTYNGYRNVPLPRLAVKVLFALQEKRLHAMRTRPGCDISIDNMWIAYMGKRVFFRCSADAVTRQANKMFEELGMRGKIAEIEEYLQQDGSAIEEEQVDMDDFAMVEKEPTAYLLRRNFATHMAILQLTDTELQFILGHVIEDPQTQRSDFLDERELFAIKQKMDKRPLLNEINCFPSSTLKGNSTVHTSGYSQDFLVPPEASCVKLSVTANEPNDPIHISVSLSEETSVHEEVGIHGTPFPHHFAKTTDVLKVYHNAFQKDDAENES